MSFTTQSDRLLQATMDSFKIRFPFLTSITTQFENQPRKLGQTVTARVRKLATTQDYDATDGYQANATSSTSMFEDVPVTLDTHKHVPVKIDHIDAITSEIDLTRAADEIAYPLGKTICDKLFSTIKGSTFSQSSAYSEANSDVDALVNMQGDMNTIGARDIGRFGIVNTAVAASLGEDSRVQSRDYFGQLNANSAYRRVSGIAGFENVWEYPGLATNNLATVTFTAVAATEVCTTATAHGLSIGDRVRVSSTTTLPAGLSAATDYYVLTVPSTTTLTVSASDGGSVINITDTGTGTHSMVGYENLTGWFGTEEGLILVAAPPEDQANELLNQVTMSNVLTDSDTGLTMVMYGWAEPKTRDTYYTIATLYGVAAGRQAGTAGTICDYAGHRLVTA
jgi:hypothetical protein